MLRDAESVRRQSDQELIQARDEARATRAAAQKRLIDVGAGLDLRRNELKDLETKLSADRLALEQYNKAVKDELEAREAVVAKREKQAEDQIIKGSELKVRYEQALKTLKADIAAV